MEYVLYAVLALVLLGAVLGLITETLQRIFPSLREDPEVARQRILARKEMKSRKKKVSSTPKKKRGPIGGSHTAEIMMFGEDPVTRRAARKVRDKFF
ncbi:putative uncharacterized protein C14orf184-like [Tepidicaulis marinus]|uniref:Uncharacterized protein n=1 Tax=Tepidicaulis marinus TaxID=1333998 RepID=A0A081B663_9HYPH|nr:hypothetical protein [Tepidicaulis marinus]GAK43531.1 putative uncharacterized protein C14orf184-like [Tepidicaulis marinus]